ncbi:MAG TPA: hypothetical protein DCS09_10745 [Porphyromonadaceae bacterium]|nr:hypothetical protein [Porphyromonadaceae bacterium]
MAERASINMLAKATTDMFAMRFKYFFGYLSTKIKQKYVNRTEKATCRSKIGRNESFLFSEKTYICSRTRNKHLIYRKNVRQNHPF